MTQQDSNERAWAVDAHFHLHRAHPLDRALTAALDNLTAAAAPGWLLLAEADGEGAWARLEAAVRTPPAGWTLDPAEPGVVVARGPAGTLRIAAGRQLVALEGIEVLALLTTHPLESGRPLEATIAAARAAGALVVLPWGFGKWWGRRGRALAAAVTGPPRPFLLLGDSGLRPRATPPPRAWRDARRRGWPTLAGSDPLPLPSHARRAASFGSRVAAPAALDAVTLRRCLGEGGIVGTFGRRRSWVAFLHDQTALRLAAARARRRPIAAVPREARP